LESCHPIKALITSVWQASKSRRRMIRSIRIRCSKLTRQKRVSSSWMRLMGLGLVTAGAYKHSFR
jgi:hypothetical protein